MTQANLAYLLERLDQLERQNRTAKRAASCATLAILAVLLMGQATPAPRVIEAEKFVVRDADGQVRILLTTTASGAALVTVMDRFGRSRAGIAVNPDHSSAVFLQHRSTKAGAAMAIGTNEIPGILLHDANGNVLWTAP